MLKTKLLPASLFMTFIIALLIGLDFNKPVDAASNPEVTSDRDRETFVERAARTRAAHLLERFDADSPRECSC